MILFETKARSSLFSPLRCVQMSPPSCCCCAFWIGTAMNSGPWHAQRDGSRPCDTMTSASPCQPNKYLCLLGFIYPASKQEAFSEHSWEQVCVGGQGRKTRCVYVRVHARGPVGEDTLIQGLMFKCLDIGWRTFFFFFAHSASKQHPTASLTQPLADHPHNDPSPRHQTHTRILKQTHTHMTEMARRVHRHCCANSAHAGPSCTLVSYMML